MASYLEGLEISLGIFVITAFGYMYSGINKFSIEQNGAIRKIVYLTALPGLYFYQISRQKMNKDTWTPLLISFLVQLVIHIIIIFIVLIFPFENKFNAFLQGIYSLCHTSYLIQGFPISQILFSNYQWVGVFISIFQNIILIPLHAALSFKVDHDDMSDQEEQKELNSSDTENEEEDENKQNSISNQEEQSEEPFEETDQIVQSIDVQTGEPILLDEKHSEAEEELNDNDKKNENLNETNPEKAEEAQPKPKCHNDDTKFKIVDQKTLKSTIIWTLINPINVVTVLAIIWALINPKMLIFISSWTFTLQKGAVAATLFVIGGYMWVHPFFGANWLPIILCMLFRIVVNPSLALAFCKLFKLNSDLSTPIILLHAMPVDLTGYLLAIYSGHNVKVASYTWFYSNLLLVPVFMLWMIIIKETYRL